MLAQLVCLKTEWIDLLESCYAWLRIIGTHIALSKFIKLLYPYHLLVLLACSMQLRHYQACLADGLSLASRLT